MCGSEYLYHIHIQQQIIKKSKNTPFFQAGLFFEWVWVKKNDRKCRWYQNDQEGLKRGENWFL